MCASDSMQCQSYSYGQQTLMEFMKRDEGMKDGQFREELCQGEEWKPWGIMGQIQPEAGNEEAIKTKSTTESVGALSLIKTVRTLNQTQLLMKGGYRRTIK